MNLTVNAWEECDTDDFAEWFTLDPLLSFQVGFDHQITKGELEMFLLSLITEELEEKSLLRAIRSEDGLVGFVCVRNMLRGTGVAHIATAPWMRGKGVEIVRAAFDAAKEDGRLKKIIAFPIALPRNVQERFLKRLGFAKTFVVGEMDL